jgi:hypothetical protein
LKFGVLSFNISLNNSSFQNEEAFEGGVNEKIVETNDAIGAKHGTEKTGWIFVWVLEIQFKLRISRKHLKRMINLRMRMLSMLLNMALRGLGGVCVDVEDLVKTEHFETVFSTITRISTLIFSMPCLAASSTSSVLSIFTLISSSNASLPSLII